MKTRSKGKDEWTDDEEILGQNSTGPSQIKGGNIGPSKNMEGSRPYLGEEGQGKRLPNNLGDGEDVGLGAMA